MRPPARSQSLNVGTCLTTDADVFDGDCDLSVTIPDRAIKRPVPWEVREEVTEVSDLYATYAYDPKTASDEPRVILEDSDLIKISIADSDRDKRTGVLIKGARDSDDLGGSTTIPRVEGLGRAVIRKDCWDDDLARQL